MPLSGLWRHPDFIRLWAAATISTFGSLVTRTALPFTAILVLDVTPFQIGLLATAELAPALLVGLVAGAWVDRLPRRPVLIATDLSRAALLVSIPIAAVADALSLAQLYGVAAAHSILTVCFDVAYQAYLPSLLQREELVEGNSKLAGSGAVAEFAAFGTAGWLVQWLSGPVAVLLDALSFLWSALLVWRIRAREPRRSPPSAAPTSVGMRREIGEGLGVVAGHPTLRAVAAANTTLNLGYAIIGAILLLYLTRELGFAPGVLGMIFAIGGLSSLLGATVAGRLLRLGVGPVMIAGPLLAATGEGLITLATDASLVAVAFLVGQQLVTDVAATVYEVTQVSLRQAIVPDRLLGRVNASMRVLEVGAMLTGALLGGLLGQTIGLRPTLLVGVGATALAGLWLGLSPVRTLRRMPSGIDASDATAATAQATWRRNGEQPS